MFLAFIHWWWWLIVKRDCRKHAGYRNTNRNYSYFEVFGCKYFRAFLMVKEGDDLFCVYFTALIIQILHFKRFFINID